MGARPPRMKGGIHLSPPPPTLPRTGTPVRTQPSRSSRSSTPYASRRLVLHADDPRDLARLRTLLPPEHPATLAEHWSEVEGDARRADCLVVLVPALRSSPVVPRLAALRARYPSRPAVLVTRWDPENSRHLKDVSVDEVVWCGEVERDLAAAVRRACSRGGEAALHHAAPLESAGHLPAVLRAALSHACRSEVPVRSVKQLAAAVGSDRRTLWYHWTRAAGLAPGLRLQDFLHWVLLLHALARKTADRPWAVVAGEVGIHACTLLRYARTLAGRTLPELAADVDGASALFRERVLRPLVAPAPLDIL